VNEAILAAAVNLPERSFAAGNQVIVEGESQHQLFVLITGTVEVARANVPVAVIDEAGAIFGELSALLKAPATASVTALDDCQFRVADDPEDFLHNQPAVALAVASTLAHRLDALTRYLVDLRNQYADRDDHLGIVDVVLESLMHHQDAPPEPGSDRESEAPY
jgi:CRP/FNR family transcriptional regulator, cyclic AMP receptor protein